MNFLIQNDAYIGSPPWADIDANILKERLIHRYVDGYREVSYNDLLLMPVENIKNEIPVGSIPFVEAWLKRVHGIDRINPIEIPKFLRTKEFVKRDYQIVPCEDVPKTGKYFVKDVSVSKKFSFSGETSVLFEDRYYTSAINRDHLFQVSEMVDIMSEYRVYVFGGKIESICHYDGDPLVFPDPDVIQKANRLYMTRPDYPRSLTIDVMVTDKGTELIEIHPFVSCGLYGTLWGDSLVYAYRDGIDYVLRHNTRIEP